MHVIASPGEIDVNLNCEQIVPANKKRHICTCREVEEQILTMAKGMLTVFVCLMNVWHPYISSK